MPAPVSARVPWNRAIASDPSIPPPERPVSRSAARDRAPAARRSCDAATVDSRALRRARLSGQRRRSARREALAGSGGARFGVERFGRRLRRLRLARGLSCSQAGLPGRRHRGRDPPDGEWQTKIARLRDRLTSRRRARHDGFGTSPSAARTTVHANAESDDSLAQRVAALERRISFAPR